MDPINTLIKKLNFPIGEKWPYGPNGLFSTSRAKKKSKPYLNCKEVDMEMERNKSMWEKVE